MITATVSHDMRTPLNAIIGLGKNLEQLVPTPAGKRLLKIVMDSATLLNFLVNDMLDLFRIRNGKFDANMAFVDLKQSL